MISLAAFLFGLMLAPSPAAAGDGPPPMSLPGQFNVSATGAATYTIPIAVPPGTAGMAPSLSLDYSSQNGDGIVGLGWSVSGLPSMTRCPRTIAQDSVHGGVNYDSDGSTGTNDRFCLDGQRLMLTAGGTHYGADGTEYRTEIEGFSKIIAHGTAGKGPAWFEVHTKSGQVMEFGNTVDSRVLAVGNSDGTARAWALNKVSDLKGNFLTVTYATDTQWTTYGQVYPLEIKYPGNTVSDPYNYVQFVYEDRLDNATPQYQAGSLVQLTKRLINVKTYVGSSTVVLDYRLGYDTMDMTNHPTWRSRLSTVTLCDAAGTPTCLPATSFTWQGSRDGLSATASTLSLPSNAVFGDFNADGLTDIVGMATSVTNATPITATFPVSYGTISGSYTSGNLSASYGNGSPARPCTDTCVLGLPRPVLTADMGGNGLSSLAISDLYQHWQGCEGLCDATFFFGLGNDGAGHLTETETLGIGIYVTRPRLTVDMNGDGHEEFITLTSGVTSYLDDFDGDGCTDRLDRVGSTSTIHYSCPAAASVDVSGQIGSSSNLVTVGDFNGDGNADVLLVGSSATLYLSTAKGLASGTALSGSSGWGSYQIVVGDWNGDGKDDIALIGSGTNHLVFLSTGNGFQQVLSITNTSTSVLATPVDLNNDGVPELRLDTTQETLVSFVPERIASISNGIGVTTTVTYDRLNHGTIYTKETNATYPMKDMVGPTYVVSGVSTSDGLGGTRNWSYAYTGAKWNHEGRGYTGFHQVAVTQTIASGSTGPQTTIVRTLTYLQTFPYIGLPASETTAVNGTQTHSRALTYNTVGSAGAPQKVHLVSSIETGSDPGTTGGPYPMPKTITSYEYDTSSGSINDYGDPLHITVCTKMKSGSTDPSDSCDANPTNWDATYVGVTKTDNTYNTPDTTHWIVGRLTAQATTSEIPGATRVRNVAFGYDLSGSSPTGFLTSQTIEPGGNCTYALESDYGYDSIGNRNSVTVKNPTNCSTTITSRTTATAYDASTTYAGQFQTGVTNALSQSETWAYNVDFGTPSSHTGPNGLTTSWSYDTFGRRTLETRADGNKTRVEYLYCSGVNGGSATCTPSHSAFVVKVTPLASNGSTVNGAIAWTYFDALGRVLAQDGEGFDGTVIRVATEYDSAGRVYRVSRPYFVSGSALWNANYYDILSRASTFTGADAIVTKYTYSGLTTAVTADYSTGSGHKNQTTTTVRNGYGQIIQVDDSKNGHTHYAYDAFGGMTSYTDASDHDTQFSIDLYGRVTIANNNDLGQWHYAYDVLGQLTTQTDAKSTTTTLAYDLLGRPTSRAEGSITETWTYDSATYGIGKLASVSCSACVTGGYARTLAYDSSGRPNSATITVNGTDYKFDTAYTADGRIDTVTDQNAFIEKRVYNSRGYLTNLKDGATGGATLWTAGTMNASLQMTQETQGNGIVINTGFNANTGRTTGVTAGIGGGNSVANYAYGYDNIGNLTSRADNTQSFSESFTYDSLNRLSTYAVSGSYTTVSVAYNKGGNVTSRTDLGTFVYGEGNDGPQEVTSCTGCTVNGTANPTFNYDPNGSMNTGAGRSFNWTAFNMVSRVTTGTARIDFAYDSDHRKVWQQTLLSGNVQDTTVYLDDPVSGVHMEVTTAGSTTTWRHFLVADGNTVGVRTNDGTTVGFRYFVLDHLGSVSILTDASGGVVERLSYDPWGRRRCATPGGTYGSNYSCEGPSASQTDVGYTGHDMLDLVGLIDMAARGYDPTLGRFLSADSMVPEPFFSQSLNRYSYVYNNPLSLVDPTGHYPKEDDPQASAPKPGCNNDQCSVPVTVTEVSWHDWHPSLDGFGGGIGIYVVSWGSNSGANTAAPGPTADPSESAPPAIGDAGSAGDANTAFGDNYAGVGTPGIDMPVVTGQRAPGPCPYCNGFGQPQLAYDPRGSFGPERPDACTEAFNGCVSQADATLRSDAAAHQRYLECRATLRVCVHDEEVVQTDPLIKGGFTFFPPKPDATNPISFLIRQGWTVWHVRGATPVAIGPVKTHGD